MTCHGGHLDIELLQLNGGKTRAYGENIDSYNLDMAETEGVTCIVSASFGEGAICNYHMESLLALPLASGNIGAIFSRPAATSLSSVRGKHCHLGRCSRLQR